jgi:hypothetical protein
VVVVTTGGRLYVWDLTGGRGPKVLLRNEEICPLNRYRAIHLIYFKTVAGGGWAEGLMPQNLIQYHTTVSPVMHLMSILRPSNVLEKNLHHTDQGAATNRDLHPRPSPLRHKRVECLQNGGKKGKVCMRSAEISTVRFRCKICLDHLPSNK